ncbi:MAG: guanylate kinase [Granulosicoccus sp.]|nr:guanylate kinase [Granulosicoccus sp.]
MQTNQAQMFIVSAPSGAGKTSLVKRTIEELDDLTVAVSHTTREQRPLEEEGRHYHFVTRDAFRDMIDSDQFLEYAEVFGNYYGTSMSAVDDALFAGQDVILEIDWQGAAQVRQKFSDVVSIFILPPSRATLIARLKGRGQDSDEVIRRRTAEAVLEMRQYHRADYLIINDAFEVALMELKSVVISHRVLKSRQAHRHAGLITSLTHD